MASSATPFSTSITEMLSNTHGSHQQNNATISNIYFNHKTSINSPFTSDKPHTWVELKKWHQSLLNFLSQDEAIQPPRRYSAIPYGQILNPNVEHDILFSDEEILKIEKLTFAKFSPLTPLSSKEVTDVFKLVFQ
ncbi:MAG: hypothetical protein K2X08_05020, partial [Chlamydiales bacterium]|nr:hypothetical protein [Chlamydiales bacterium]